ncbi:MAG TPA: GPP34 family phosphoprotein [Bacteroidales bacterium]|nr:GPP34 family phosphoprotein [Bacteroidales bacterium]
MEENYITIPEEVFLLSIDEAGEQLDIKEFDIVLASSILMELALQNCIDTDLDYIIPDKKKSTGNYVLDDISMDIHDVGEKQTITSWILKIYSNIHEIKKQITKSLVRKKIIKIENERVLLIFSSKRYPIIRKKEVIEVRLRLRELIFGQEIPDFRDIVIISLIHYASLEFLLFTEKEAEEYKTRIEEIAKMDLIGQAITSTLKEVTLAMRAKEMFGFRSPQQKLDDMVKGYMKKHQLKKENQLPDWLKKGTVQYRKTLEFIEKSGTAEIEYDPESNTYSLQHKTAGSD